ncbi:MAG: cyclic nucleotide-binding domain-containing protein [Chloroflexota bacterium]
MSQDNSLDDLIQATRRRKAESPPAAGRPEEKKALNPLDLLTLPTPQREIVNFLSRHKQARLEEIQQKLQSIPAAELVKTIQTLKEIGYIREALIEGEVFYRVAFGGATSRSKIFLPEHIWSSLTVDNLTFLNEMPLFRQLPESELRQLANELENRHYRRNEVIVWQDEPSEDAFLIKNGLVGISRLSPGRRSSQNLAYLKQGDILGEIGVLENQVRSATATALSKVDVLVIKRARFLSLLKNYDSAALELARLLGRQLVATSARLDQRDVRAYVVLIFGLEAGVGCTTLAGALAATLAGETRQPTVYTEHHPHHQLPHRFGFSDNLSLYHHPAGFDIWLPQVDPSLPQVVDTTLLLDRLLGQYHNIIIGLPINIDESIIYLLERASQIVLISPPGLEAWARLNALRTELKGHVHPGKTGIFTIVNRTTPAAEATPGLVPADFDLPFLADLPPLARLGSRGAPLPEPLARVSQAIADRLGRTHELAVYIPTTIEVDRSFDTTPCVQKTLAFLGEHFGGATSSQAQGVWDSEEAGLVSETVYIVRSFVTQPEIDQHLNTVLDYVAGLKTELKQEAMALEVDQKFMLV